MAKMRSGEELHPHHQFSESVDTVLELDRDEQLTAFGQQLVAQGFTVMRRFLDDIRGYMRSYMDAEVANAQALVERLAVAIPEPGRISPSWQDVWTEFRGIVRYKSSVLERIPEGQRDGEWQVLLDNPYSNQHIAVYPGLEFHEAAYMYAYFRTGLEHNEFIRLQKVETVIMNTGADE